MYVYVYMSLCMGVCGYMRVAVYVCVCECLYACWCAMCVVWLRVYLAQVMLIFGSVEFPEFLPKELLF